ncbi:DNA-dependent protein kinase catalytic subunit-like [Seriola lalandi dorsalis]|uniref:DNA-dependent protein kinase catalytic subunit-like n=1 Tax=Seriola lalandi dorsalis TaxID=1841481 RepID=UPI000C6F80BD|nr:DNA-dependent protein kinase catalytic subunit-like [Seriola lalandi dorsalis]
MQHVPSDLLKRAFLKMCNSPEAFLSLRSHFTSSHALLCVSHWILGIGDRHLSNFMINMETGGMIGIDFGHAFGSATQVGQAKKQCYLSEQLFKIHLDQHPEENQIPV